MITLIKFHPAFGLADPSPFVMKVMMLLKMAGRAYDIELAFNPSRGPKGKLPAIRDDGELIGDSEIIRWHIETKYGFDFDQGLSLVQRATAHAFARMIEERFYWVMVHARWLDPAGWPKVRGAFFGGLPPVVRTIVPALIQKRVAGRLHAQGVGRHNTSEMYRMGVLDIRAIGAQLGDKPWFMGAEPTGVDCTVYPFIAGTIDPPFDNPVKDEALKHANLVAYAQRGKARFFS
jgi:glutathione S-transferase